MLKKTNPSQWKKISNRKWELKVDNVVLGTISYKPVVKKLISMVGGDPSKAKPTYSVYFSVPKIYDRIIDTSQTYKFDTLEESQQKFDELYEEKCLKWIKTFCKHYKVNLNNGK